MCLHEACACVDLGAAVGRGFAKMPSVHGLPHLSFAVIAAVCAALGQWNGFFSVIRCCCASVHYPLCVDSSSKEGLAFSQGIYSMVYFKVTNNKFELRGHSSCVEMATIFQSVMRAIYACRHVLLMLKICLFFKEGN